MSLAGVVYGTVRTEALDTVVFMLHPEGIPCNCEITRPHWLEVSTGAVFAAYHRNLYEIVRKRQLVQSTSP